MEPVAHTIKQVEAEEPLLQRERLWEQAHQFSLQEVGEVLAGMRTMRDSMIAHFIMLMQRLLRLQIVDNTSHEGLVESEVLGEVLEELILMQVTRLSLMLPLVG